MASVGHKNLLTQAALAAATTAGDTYGVLPKSNGFVGKLKVANAHAATTVTAKIQHSPNGTDWFDLMAFTATAAGAAADEIKVPTVPVLANLRAHVVLGGATKLADVTIDVYFDPKATA